MQLSPHPSAGVRNVVLVGPAGSGKTTVLAALTGAAPAAGPTTRLGVGTVTHEGVTVTLLDTPGDPDLAGALVAGLRAADAALFVVSAAGGLDAVTAQLWAACERDGVPRAVAVTQLDHPRADADEAVALCQRLLDDTVLAVQLPVHDDDGAAAGVLDLLRLTVTDHSGGTRVERPADPEHVRLVADLRAELVETVVGESEDPGLLDRYLDGEELDPELLVAELRAATARGHLHPAVVVAPLLGAGVRELLDLLAHGLPSPLSRQLPRAVHPDGSPAAPLACDPEGPLAAEVVRTGGTAYVRVLSGTLRTVGGPDCPAGRVGAVTGLVAHTGQTLSSSQDPLQLEPWPLPEPQAAVALEPAPGSEHLLDGALSRLLAEDPTLRLERQVDTGQLLLWTLGARHADVVLERLRTDGLAVRTPVVQLPQRRSPDGTLLEPWSSIEVRVPTAFARTVVSDLTSRGARALTSRPDPEDDEDSSVGAELADAQLLTYAAALRSVAHGTGRLVRRPLGWEPVG